MNYKKGDAKHHGGKSNSIFRDRHHLRMEDSSLPDFDGRLESPRKTNAARILTMISTLGVALLFVTYHSLGGIMETKRSLTVDDGMVQNEMYTEDLFVPSLLHSYDFHHESASDKDTSNSNKESAHGFQGGIPEQQCQVPKQLYWEWKRYSMHSKNQTQQQLQLQEQPQQKTSKKRMLIGIYYDIESLTGLDGDVHEQIQQRTIAINEAYAKEWSSDFVVLSASETDGSCSTNQRMSLLRLRLLFYGVDRKEQYDQLVLLDAHAMMTNMRADISTLMHPDNDIVLAPKIFPKEEEHTFRVNPRIMVWNLEHPGTKVIAREWFDAVLNPESEINRVAPFKGRYLQYILRQYPSHVRALDWEFSGIDGYVGRYYADGIEQGDSGRGFIHKLDSDIRSICHSHSTQCDVGVGS